MVAGTAAAVLTVAETVDILGNLIVSGIDFYGQMQGMAAMTPEQKAATLAKIKADSEALNVGSHARIEAALDAADAKDGG